MCKIRNLRADEIEVRVGQLIYTDASKTAIKGVCVLLYKDARCDMNILDEVFGAMNWQCEYTRDNRNCMVSIWDPGKSQWIIKEDTGTESETEAEKGLASDAFKRACVKVGIGRELYTSPKRMFIPTNDKYIKLDVKSISYKKNENGEEMKVIDAVEIVDVKGNVVYQYQAKKGITSAPIAPKSEELQVLHTPTKAQKIEAAKNYLIKANDKELNLEMKRKYPYPVGGSWTDLDMVAIYNELHYQKKLI